MIKKLILIAFASSTLALNACASDSAKAAGGDDFSKQVADVKASMKSLKAEDALWRDTGKFLDEAVEAHKAGDTEKADKLLKRAAFEVDAAQRQYESQKDAKPHY
jgi:hypothetical protein